MAHDLKLVVSRLKELLAADASMEAWRTGYDIDAFNDIDGNIEINLLRKNDLPARVFEITDGQYRIKNSCKTEATPELVVAMLWREKDPAAALVQRLDLPKAMAEALRTDPTLQAACQSVVLSDFEYAVSSNDLSVQIARFTLTVTAQF